MKDEYTSANARDFANRYANTYCLYEYPDRPDSLLVFIQRVNGESVSFVDAAGNPYKAVRDGGVKFTFTQIEQGWYIDEEGNPVLLSRNAARQFSRGICDGNTTVRVLKSNRLCAANVDFTTLSPVVSKKTEGRGCRVLGRSFLLTDKYLWIYNETIGTVSGSHITLNSELFVQEVTDYLRRENIKFTVSVNDNPN